MRATPGLPAASFPSGRWDWSSIDLTMSQPLIIQGGMGVAVSGWPQARAVSLAGQLGVVSGTALAVVLARRLQLGDPGGELRRALAHFPLPQMAERVRAEHYIAGGKSPGTPFKLTRSEEHTSELQS